MMKFMKTYSTCKLLASPTCMCLKVLATVALTISTVTSSFASDYKPLVSRGNSDFNTVFSPDQNGSGSILYVDSALKEVDITGGTGINTNLEWRIFVPPGTKSADVVMFTFSSAEETMITARFGSPPSGTIDDVNEIDGSNAASKVLPRLLADEEVVYFGLVFTNVVNGVAYQSSSGSTRLLARPDYQPYIPTTKGGWIYFKTWQVPGQTIQGIDVNIKVDQTCYESWFAKAKFDSSGNPAENVEHTCAGSGSNNNDGNNNASDLIAIALSSPTITQGGSTVTINPAPNYVSLPTCTASDSSGATSKLVQVVGSTISVLSGAQSVSARQDVTIRCNGKTAVLGVLPRGLVGATLTAVTLSSPVIQKDSTSSVTLIPQPSSAMLPICNSLLPGFGVPNPYISINGNSITLTPNARNITSPRDITINCDGKTVVLRLDVSDGPTEIIEADGSLSISYKLAINSQDMSKAGQLFVAVRFPAFALLFNEVDTFYFTTPLGWVPLSADFNKLSFSQVTSFQTTQSLMIKTGLPMARLRALGADLHVAYQATNGEFQYLGVIWK